MTIAQTYQPKQKPLRLWPGVVAVVLQWLVWFGIPIVVPEAMRCGAYSMITVGPWMRK